MPFCKWLNLNLSSLRRGADQFGPLTVIWKAITTESAIVSSRTEEEIFSRGFKLELPMQIRIKIDQ